jgi:hypothetical protein
LLSSQYQGAGDVKAECVFTFESTTKALGAKKEEPKKEEAPPVASNSKALIEKLRGTCATKTIDYWDYEVLLL